MIIGIGGCSRAGKTTLAELIMWHYRKLNFRVIAIHQDDYVKRIRDIPLINEETDWETPDSIDFDLLEKSISFHRTKFDVIVLEGILTFASAELNKHFDRAFFIEISLDTFLKRRKAETRWGEEPDWYLEHVWASFQLFGQPPTTLEKLVKLSGETDSFQTADLVSDWLEKLPNP